MTTIKYLPSLKITNTEQLPRGTGAKFLLVLISGDTLIAHSWKCTEPKVVKSGYALVDFRKGVNNV